MRRKMINYMATFLHECGIEIFRKDPATSRTTTYCKIWRLLIMGSFFSTIVLGSMVYSILNRDDFYNAISTMPFFAATFTSMSAAVTVLQYKRKLSQMLYQMDKNMYTYPDEDLLHLKYKWYLREGNIITVMNIIWALHYVIVTAIALPGFAELYFYGRIKTFLYPTWTPWKVDDLKSQLFTFLFQCFTLICGATINMINVLTLYISFFEFYRQYERLIIAVKSLKRRSLTKIRSDGIPESNYDQITRENIVHCIRHYQVQYKNLLVFEEWFSNYFSYELTVYVLSFAFGLFITMDASSLDKVINQLAMISYTNFSILIKCIIGDVLVELNNSLADSLFSQMEWYEISKDNRKLVQIFHMFVQRRPISVMGYSIFQATRVTFAEVLRCAYSVFNVVKMKR